MKIPETRLIRDPSFIKLKDALYEIVDEFAVSVDPLLRGEGDRYVCSGLGRGFPCSWYAAFRSANASSSALKALCFDSPKPRMFHFSILAMGVI
jgi:hypothetical protein